MKHEVNISKVSNIKLNHIKNKLCIIYGKSITKYPFGFLLFEHGGSSYMSIPNHIFLKEIIKL